MTIHHTTPYILDKNFGGAYNNEFMRHTSDDDFVCARDGDTMFLTSDWGEIIFNYAYQNPSAVMICYTNRIHRLATDQLLFGKPIDNPDINYHIALAKKQKEKLYQVSPTTSALSGFLVLIPKKIWNIVKFREGCNLLGVDTGFFKDVRAAGFDVLRMDGLYVFHTYRIDKDIKDDTHLR